MLSMGLQWCYNYKMPENEIATVPETEPENKVLSLIRSHYPQYHPLVSIAHIAHSCDGDQRLELECHKTIAKYVEQELKSVEHKGHIDHEINTLRVIIDDRQAPEPAVIDGEAEIIQEITFDSFTPSTPEVSDTVRGHRELVKTDARD